MRCGLVTPLILSCHEATRARLVGSSWRVLGVPGRVLLASLLFAQHKGMQMVAITGIVVLGYLAVENGTFGFERIVGMRSAQVKVKWLTAQSLNAVAGLTPQQRINSDFFELERQRQQSTEPTFAAYPPGQIVATGQLSRS